MRRGWLALALGVLAACPADGPPATAPEADAVAVSDLPDVPDEVPGDAAADAESVADADAESVADAGPWSPYLADASFTTECVACHPLGPLRAESATADMAPRDHLLAAGAAGLVRVDPAIPSPDPRYHLDWPARGYHGVATEEGCDGCHPVQPDGIGHGVRTYRFPDTVFQGGTDCAATCHDWLPDAASAVGFEPADGPAPSWEGSLRPAALLQAVTTAHTTLWQEGARPTVEGDFRVVSFNPGCGGCHNLAAEAHGETPSCIACHRFVPAGGSHSRHVGWIAQAASAVDPDHAVTGATLCAYCHADGELGPTERSRAVCYNCHLSGHQPLDAAGEAHLWPMP